MDTIKTLNELKALEMKRQHIETAIAENGNPFESSRTVTINGKNILVSVTSLNAMLSSELKKAKIEYDDKLKSLIDDGGGF